MRYYYEICEIHDGVMKVVDTGTSHTLHTVVLASDQYIQITDHVGVPTITILNTNDEFHEWFEGVSRSAQWQDASKVAKVDQDNNIEKTISTMKVQPTTNKVGAVFPKPGFTELTLGQLKLEDANVKTAAAAKKPRVAAVPPIAIMALGAAMQSGADKYGLFNWRDTSVTATVFYNAMLRHLEQWYSGENHASDSGIHHLAHLMAGAAIILDAEMNNVFNDDRPKGVALGDDYAKWFQK